MDEALLLFGREQKYEAPRGDSLGHPFEEGRVRHAFARNRDLREVVSECSDERRRCIKSVIVQAFCDKDLGNAQARAAAYIDNRSPRR